MTFEMTLAGTHVLIGLDGPQLYVLASQPAGGGVDMVAGFAVRFDGLVLVMAGFTVADTVFTTVLRDHRLPARV